MYFDPQHLYLAGRNGYTSTFFYDGVRIDAASDGQFVFVNVSSVLPKAILQGLLHWFGIDTCREMAHYRFPDNSRYYVQKAA
ncbi:MAG: hypothetical protein IJ246_00185 [Clostridia bacterium]|nr:hypothetical protein [Clostridia bacterium]